jgi:hypothetical protein
VGKLLVIHSLKITEIKELSNRAGRGINENFTAPPVPTENEPKLPVPTENEPKLKRHRK